jgi:lipopolysaccharide assembly outer membrane protein LptD (OstA)
MLVRVHAWVLPVFLLLTGAPSAFAQLIPDWQNKQFTFERIDADRIRLVGQAEIVGEGSNAGNQIFADEVEWNIRTGEFIATGNVLLVSPTSRLSAERVVFNTKTKLGTFETASGIASLGSQGAKDRSMFGTLEPEVYFYGKTIEKIGDDKYRIHDGWFTTCVQPTPRWQIVSGSATINLGDYAILRNAVMRVKDVPMFYLPVLYYPIQDDDRATGFLLPTYGTSLYRGSSLSNAFFWAINRSQDATFMHDWFANRGQGIGSEYRYVSGPVGNGNFRAYFLNEKAAAIDLPDGGVSLQPARKSYEFRGQLVQPLPGRLTARANVDYFSDVVTQQLYNTNIYDATRSQRQYGGTVAGAWGAVSVTSRYQRSEVFLSQIQSVTSGAEPGVAVNVSSTRFGQWPLYFAMTSDATRNIFLDRLGNADGTVLVKDLGVTRVDMFPTLRAPFTRWPFLTLNTHLGVRTTYFSESLVNVEGRDVQLPVGLWRRYAEMRAELTGPVFSRVFTPQNGFADRLKHLIEPNFSVSRITHIDNQDRIPQTGSAFDVVIGGTTRMSYGLTNRFLLRKERTRTPDMDDAAAAGLAALSAAPREFLSVSVSQSYYTDENASRYDPSLIGFGVRPPSKFSPIVLNVRSAPSLFSTATFIAEYDASEGRLENMNFSGGVNYPQVNAQVGLSSSRFGEDRRNTFDARTTLSLDAGRIGGTYAMNWDLSANRILNQRWIGFYNAQCCGLMLEFQKFAYALGNTIPADQRFNISFTLAGIGSFSNFFGAFGGGRY